MLNRVASLLFFLNLTGALLGQDLVFTGTTEGILPHNPAFAGLEGGQVVRISYTSVYPASGFGLGSYFAQWSGNFDGLHGGISAWALGNQLGDVYGQMSGGAGYAYHFRIARNLFASSGLAISVINTAVRGGKIIFQDQINPVYGPIGQSADQFAGLSRSVVNVSAGGVLYNDIFFVSWAADYLNKPDLTGSKNPDHRLKRTLYGYTSYRYSPSFINMVIVPALSSALSKDDYNFVQTVSLESGDFSINGGLNVGKDRHTAVQGGFGFRSESIGFSYCYRLNTGVKKGYSLPLTAFHSAGIAIRLYNVDKRNNRQTINFPKL